MTSSKLIEGHLPCPKCPSSDAYSVYDDGHGFCFSCRQYFHPDGSISSSAGLQKGFNLVGNFTYEYLPWRGISADTMRFFEAKTKIDEEGKPVAIGFKYPNGSYKIRSLEEKVFYTEGEISKAGLFGKDKFSQGGHKYVTITEGEVDALSLYQILEAPVVSVQSAATAGRDCSADRAWLNSFERIYLAFDADEPGRRACAEVARLFDYNKVYHVKFDKRKDANDYLQAGEQSELKRIWWNSKKFLPENIISSFAEFEAILREKNHDSVPYPFACLNKMTYGIRRGETVLLMAQEKVGKTELMHAIEYNLLKETDSNVAAIFVEEPKQRHFQALAGYELQRPIHLPDYACSPDEAMDALKSVVQKDERLHVYSHFGSDDPDVIIDHVRFLASACSCHYVLLDHLAMVVSGLGGEDERKAIDYITTRLEMLVKELNFALIMVHHMNDHGQSRSSRYPTKVADITITATRDLMSSDPVERNRVHLSVPYNRFSGKTGYAGSVLFIPEKSKYIEDGGFAAANDTGEGNGTVLHCAA